MFLYNYAKDLTEWALRCCRHNFTYCLHPHTTLLDPLLRINKPLATVSRMNTVSFATILFFLASCNQSLAWMSSGGLKSSFKSTSARASTATLVDFSKYEGLGNDFILVDDRDSETPSLTPEESERLCHRNFGVGGDGVIFALKPSSDDYDFKMRIYNSDGSEPEMCGNGIRCFAQFLKDLGADGT